MLRVLLSLIQNAEVYAWNQINETFFLIMHMESFYMQ